MSVEPGPIGSLEELTELHIIPNTNTTTPPSPSTTSTTVSIENKKDATKKNQLQHRFSIRAVPSLKAVVDLDSSVILPPYQCFINRDLLLNNFAHCCVLDEQRFYAEIEVVDISKKDHHQNLQQQQTPSTDPPPSNQIRIVVELCVLNEDHFSDLLMVNQDLNDAFVVFAHPIILEQLQIESGALVNLYSYHKEIVQPNGIVLHCEASCKDFKEDVKNTFKRYMTKCQQLTDRRILLNQGTLLAMKVNGVIYSVVIELMDVINALCATVDVDKLPFLTFEVDEDLTSTSSLTTKNLAASFDGDGDNDILQNGSIGDVLIRLKTILVGSPEFCHHPLVTSNQQSVLLHGSGDAVSTGIGKSYILHLMKKTYKDVFDEVLSVECVYLHGKKPSKIGEYLTELINKMRYVSSALILIDDLDELLSNVDVVQDGQARSQYVLRIVSAFQEFMESVWSTGKPIHIVATCSSLDRIHKNLLPESNVHIFHDFIELPSNFKLPDQFFATCQKFSVSKTVYCCLKQTDSEAMEDVSKQLEGLNLRDFSIFLRHVCNRKLKETSREEVEKGKKITIEISSNEMTTCLKEFQQSSKHNMQLHTPNPVSWSDVGGLLHVKKLLIETLIWPVRYGDLFKKCHIKSQSGVLLYGAPGTAKTLLASAAAYESNLSFITIKGPELLSKYVGSSEGNVRDLFARAQAAKPCLLFFDELESLAPKRGHDNTGVTDRVVNQLLTQLDGVESCDGVYIIAASSRPDLIDPALLRPGRIDKSILCALPDFVDRKEIITILLRGVDYAEDVDVLELATATTDFSGADLKALVLNAQLENIHEVIETKKQCQNHDADDNKNNVSLFKLLFFS